jgi:hypothetical protein
MEPPTTVPDGAPEAADERNPGKLTYEDVDAMTKSELKTVCKDCGLSTSGTKTDLFNDVVEYLGLVD